MRAGERRSRSAVTEGGGGGEGSGSMDGAELTSPSMPEAPMHHISRPTLGFPLGTALLLIIIFCLSGIFSCCYHWDKLRSLRGLRPSSSASSLPTTTTAANTAANRNHSDQASSFKLTSMHQESKQSKDESLPVIMPGDKIPKFMAWPCPCQTTTARVLTVGVDLLPVPSTSILESNSSPPAPSVNYSLH